jgi:hypothetical protein
VAESLARHGCASLGWALAVLPEWDTHRQRRCFLFRVSLGTGALLVSATWYFGGIRKGDFFKEGF